MSRNDMALLYDRVQITYMRIVWTHKIMEKQTDIYSMKYNICLFLKVLFCLGTFKGAFDVINTGGMEVIQSIIIFLGSVFTAILEEFKFDSLRDECKSSAIEYLYLRDRTEDLLVDIKSEGLNWEDSKGEFFGIRAAIKFTRVFS